MRKVKIKCSIRYPWIGVEDEEENIEIDERELDTPITNADIEEAALNCIEEMLWDRVSTSWEVIEDVKE